MAVPVETVPLARFIPIVMPYVRNVPLPLLTRMVRLAAIEFCERTRCWRELVTVTVDERNEALVAPAYAAIHQIEWATIDGIDLIPTQFSDTSAFERTLDGLPKYITQIQPNAIALIPYAPGTVELSVFLKPVEGAEHALDANGLTVDTLDVIPRFMLQQFGQKIAYGALGRLQSIPGQTFTDMNMAGVNMARFERACDTNFAENLEMQHRAPMRTRVEEF